MSCARRLSRGMRVGDVVVFDMLSIPFRAGRAQRSPRRGEAESGGPLLRWHRVVGWGLVGLHAIVSTSLLSGFCNIEAKDGLECSFVFVERPVGGCLPCPYGRLVQYLSHHSTHGELYFFCSGSAAVTISDAGHFFLEHGHGVASQGDDGVRGGSFTLVVEVFIDCAIDQLLCLGNGSLLF